MGMFLSITGVVGKTEEDVVNILVQYAESVGGGLVPEVLPIENDNCCVIAEADGNTTIFNPYAFLEWDQSSQYISSRLNAPVFSFHIHDGDFWMYTLFVNGEIVDQFNPLPDYFDDNISEEEIEAWRGNAQTISGYVSYIQPAAIDNYLVRWDLDAEESKKAYPDDEFVQEDWQLLDFMRKLKLPYPLDEDGNPSGETYKLWTKELPLVRPSNETGKTSVSNNKRQSVKPWWKFW